MPAVKAPKNYLIAFLALACLAVGFVAWKQYAELAGLRVASVNDSERADLQKRLWDAEKRARDLAAQLAARADASADEEVAAGPGGDNANRARGNRNNRGGPGGPGGFAAMMAFMEKPEIQKAMAIQQKAALDGQYAALFKKLNLSPDQLEKFKTLLTERQSSIMDVMAAARTQGIDPRTDREGMRKAITDAQAEIDSSIRSAIGDQAYNQYKQYDATAPQRNLLNQLDQRLSYSGGPLNEAQQTALVQILADTAPVRNLLGRQNQTNNNNNATTTTAGAATTAPAPDLGGGFGRGGPPGGGGMFGGALANIAGPTPQISAETLSRAQAVLAQPQLTALAQLQREQQAAAALAAAARAQFETTRNNNNNPPGAATPAKTPAKRTPGGG